MCATETYLSNCSDVVLLSVCVKGIVDRRSDAGSRTRSTGFSNLEGSRASSSAIGGLAIRVFCGFVIASTGLDCPSGSSFCTGWTCCAGGGLAKAVYRQKIPSNH